MCVISFCSIFRFGHVIPVAKIFGSHVPWSGFMLTFKSLRFSHFKAVYFSEGTHLSPVPQPSATVATHGIESLILDKIGTGPFRHISLCRHYSPSAAQINCFRLRPRTSSWNIKPQPQNSGDLNIRRLFSSFFSVYSFTDSISSVR